MMLQFRRMDNLGRITIPVDIRREIGGIGPRTPIHIKLDDNKRIILEKAEFTCFLCGTDTELIMNIRQNAVICKECLRDFTDNGQEIKEAE
jgi:bifunctional DNA-binding transcriptional regulator/antitoxin component of YhaV-PrlF toxin-antitoxin module